jgi:hypothetical protein
LIDRQVHPQARRVFHPTRTTSDPFQKSADEVRIMEILPPEHSDNWLHASAKVSGDFSRVWLTELMGAGQIIIRQAQGPVVL